VNHLNCYQFSLRCGGPNLAGLIIQRAKSVPLKMVWELPATFRVLDAIEPHTDRISFLTLFITGSLYRRDDANLSRLTHLRLDSLRHIFIPFSDESNTPVYLRFLSGLRLDRLTFEVRLSYDISPWFIGTSIWEHITTLIVHGGMFQQPVAIRMLTYTMYRFERSDRRIPYRKAKDAPCQVPYHPK
jgi:hypothetical protein